MALHAAVRSVNLARPRTSPDTKSSASVTGIDKVPTADPVEVRAPGPMRGGLV